MAKLHFKILGDFLKRQNYILRISSKQQMAKLFFKNSPILWNGKIIFLAVRIFLRLDFTLSKSENTNYAR